MFPTLAIANEFIRVSNFSLSFWELQDCLFLTEGVWSKFRDTRLMSSSLYLENGKVISLSAFYAYQMSPNKLATDYCGEPILLNDEIPRELVKYVYEKYQQMNLNELKDLQSQLSAGPYKLIDFKDLKQVCSQSYFFNTL